MVLKNNRDKGFTLVSLLITLAIIAVLAVVVILSATGMFERGSKQTMKMETDIIQTAVNLFNSDIHSGVGNGIWGAGVLGHYFPTEDGKPGSLTEDSFPITVEDGNPESVLDGIIWMGLLANTPGSSEANNPAYSSTQEGEDGPYLNEIPESASIYNGRNIKSGPYTWIVLSDGAVAAVEMQGDSWVLISSGTGSSSGGQTTPPPTSPVGKTYTLEIESTSGGSVLVPGEGVFFYDEGKKVLIDAFTSGCNEFVNWTGDVDTVADTTAATTTITMNDNCSIKANFMRGDFVRLNIEVVPENEAWISIWDKNAETWALDENGVPVDGSRHKTPASIMVPFGEYTVQVEKEAWTDHVNLSLLSPAVCEVTVSIQR